jgi:hypothetical protein
VVVVCCVVVAFRGRNKWLWISISNCVYVVSKLVQISGILVLVYLRVFSGCCLVLSYGLLALQGMFAALC